VTAATVVLVGWNEVGMEEEEERVSCSSSFRFWAVETGEVSDGGAHRLA